MPSYNHRFIYNVIIPSSDNNAENINKGIVTRSKESIRELPEGKKAGNTKGKENRSGTSAQGTRARIRALKRSILQGERRKAHDKGTRSLVLSPFLFSPNIFIILQALDDICFQINPTLFGALILK